MKTLGDPPNDALARVVRAELDFAELGVKDGNAAFLANMDDQSLGFTPGPKPGRPDFEKGETFTGLVWYPVVAGVALSGDLGWTSGPFTIGKGAGTYFTIWRKTPAGWKIVLDYGVGSPKPDPMPPVLQPGLARQVPGIPTDVEGARQEVDAAEAVFASRGYRGLSDAQTRFHRDGFAPSNKVPNERATQVAISHRGMSAAGDLAYTIGSANVGDRMAYWVRLWKRKPEGWRIVIDVTRPEPKRA